MVPSSSTEPRAPGGMHFLLNGQNRPLPRAMSVRELLEELELPSDRVAVELNRRILKRSDFAAASVGDGDEVEIVTFVGGG